MYGGDSKKTSSKCTYKYNAMVYSDLLSSPPTQICGGILMTAESEATCATFDRSGKVVHYNQIDSSYDEVTGLATPEYLSADLSMHTVTTYSIYSKLYSKLYSSVSTLI